MFSRKISGLNLRKKSRLNEPGKMSGLIPTRILSWPFSRHRLIPHQWFPKTKLTNLRCFATGQWAQKNSSWYWHNLYSKCYFFGFSFYKTNFCNFSLASERNNRQRYELWRPFIKEVPHFLFNTKVCLDQLLFNEILWLGHVFLSLLF